MAMLAQAKLYASSTLLSRDLLHVDGSVEGHKPLKVLLLFQHELEVIQQQLGFWWAPEKEALSVA